MKSSESISISANTANSSFQVESVNKNEKTTKKKRKRNSQGLSVEELNNFRETQHLFNSSPFRSQLEELLKAENVKERTSNKLNKWIEDIKHFLLHIDFSLSVEVKLYLRSHFGFY